MSEQRFEVFQECEYLEEWSSCPYCIKYDGETVFETLPLGIAKEVCRKLNEQQDQIQSLKEENEQLKKQLSKYDKPKISIFNKDKGDWKWNDNNDIILNIITGKSFYLRNSGAVENLVGMLNTQQATINELEKNFDDLVEWASEIAKRNVLLDERIGKIQQAIKRAYEEKPYPRIEDIQAKFKELNDE